MSNSKIIRCEICGRIIENAKQDKDGTIYGIGCNNPFPLRYRVCCDSCSSSIISPLRNTISYIRAVVENEQAKDK